MKNTFSQWFFGSGWKSYILPYVIYVFVLYGCIMGADSYYDTPVFWLCLGGVAVLGFGIGITFHMIDAYKNSER